MCKCKFSWRKTRKNTHTVSCNNITLIEFYPIITHTDVNREDNFPILVSLLVEWIRITFFFTDTVTS